MFFKNALRTKLYSLCVLVALSLFPNNLQAETVSNLSFLDDLSEASLKNAINKSLEYIRNNPKGAISYGKQNISRSTIRQSLKLIKRALKIYGLSPKFYSFLNENFSTHAISDEVILTGYFEAELEGSLTPDEVYKYPIYSVPPELASYKEKNKPYFNREEIDFKGALAKQNLELAWTNDPVKLFFMHIQGSGKLHLPTGEIIDLQYADNNGRSYRSIARKLLSEHAIKSGKISMQAISKYLKDNPQRLQEVLSFNERYIFFRRVQAGPIGSLDVQLTPKRSIALDQTLYPSGAIFLLKAAEAKFNQQNEFIGWQPFTRLVLNQDSGIAIQGKNKTDYFLGFGTRSELLAGHQYYRGNLSLLLPKIELKKIKKQLQQKKTLLKKNLAPKAKN